MQTRKTATTTRQPVKTAARTTTPTRKAAPAKPAVRAAAPVRKTVATAKPARRMVKADAPACVPGEGPPCNPAAITFSCVLPNIPLSCLPLADAAGEPLNIIIVRSPPITGSVVDSDVIAESDLDDAFATVAQIAGCVETSCTEGVCDPAAPYPITDPYICSITPTDSVVTINRGEYKVIRTFLVTDACGNTASISQTVTFTVSDGIGPNNTIKPALSTFPLTQLCMEGTNPAPTCTALLTEGCDCECVFLPGCRPAFELIDTALGTATADGCQGKVTFHDTGPFPDGDCYEYWIRTFTAKDECCNESTKCRVVRYLKDAINPTITVTPIILDLVDQFPGSSVCTADENPDADCECIDLGCNPSHPDFPPTTTDPTGILALIKYVLGVGTAGDVCGPAQVCTKTSRKVGDCCHFSQKRTFTAVDPCGNTAEKKCRVVIWKINDDAPIIQCASDKMVSCLTTVEQAKLLFDTPDAFDFCDGCIQLDDEYTYDTTTVDPLTGKVTSITRHWSATDSCLKTAYGEQTITFDCDPDVCDDENGAPRISCSLPNTRACGLPRPTTADFYKLLDEDVSGFTQDFGDLTVVYGNPEGIVDYHPATRTYSILITVRGTGIYTGEIATCTEELKLANCGIPTVNCALPSELPCNSAAPTLSAFQRPTSGDVSGFTQPFADLVIDPAVGDNSAVVSSPGPGTSTTYTVTFIVSGTGDFTTESDSCTQTITVPKCATQTPLVIECPTTATTIACGTVPTDSSFPLITVTSQCNNVIVSAVVIVGIQGTAVSGGINYTRTVRVTDACNQTKTCVQTVFSPTCPTVVQKGCTKGF